MALYVDSAYLGEVAQTCATFPIAGVTTNPTILLKALERGQRMRDVDVLRELLQLCPGPVFMQPAGDTPQGLRAAALRYMEADPARVVLKLPMNAEGVRVALDLKGEGARLAFTAVASLAQAYSGVSAGAEWMIPYFGRLRRAGIDACERVTSMARLMASENSSVRILAASVKSPGDVVEATTAGAHDVTAPPDVIRLLTEDPLTEAAVTQFAADWKRMQQVLGE